MERFVDVLQAWSVWGLVAGGLVIAACAADAWLRERAPDDVEG